MGLAEDLLADISDDEEQAAPSIAERLLADIPDDDVPEGAVAERGFIGDTASRAARGVVDLAETTAQAADVLVGGSEITKTAKDYWRDLPEKVDFLKPDVSEATGQEGAVKRGFGGAVESAPVSAAIIPAAAAGFAIGGPVGSFVGGTAALIGLFGAGTYGKQKDVALEELKASRPELDDKAREDIAHENAMAHAYAETLGEGAGDLAAYLIFSRLPGGVAAYRGGKEILKNLVNPNFVKAIGKGFLKAVPFEVGSEVGTSYFQAEADKKAGIQTMSTGQQMLESIIPAMFLSGGMGVVVGGYSAYQRKKSYDGLNQGNPNDRAQAVNAVASTLYERAGDENIAKEWRDKAMTYVRAGQQIPLDQDLINFVAAREAENGVSDKPIKTAEPAGPVSRALNRVTPTTEQTNVRDRQEETGAGSGGRGEAQGGSGQAGTISQINAAAGGQNEGGLRDQGYRESAPAGSRPAENTESGGRLQGQQLQPEGANPQAGQVRNPGPVGESKRGRDWADSKSASFDASPYFQENLESPDTRALGMELKAADKIARLKEKGRYTDKAGKVTDKALFWEGARSRARELAAEAKKASVFQGAEDLPIEQDRPERIDPETGEILQQTGGDINRSKADQKTTAEVQQIVDRINAADQETITAYQGSIDERFEARPELKPFESIIRGALEKRAVAVQPREGKADQAETAPKAEAGKEEGQEGREGIAPEPTGKRLSDPIKGEITDFDQSDKINGISRAVAGDMMAAGDEEVLAHIREGVKTHGRGMMSHVIRNQAMAEIGEAIQDGTDWKAVQARIKKLQPEIDKILTGVPAAGQVAPATLPATDEENLSVANAVDSKPDAGKEVAQRLDISFDRNGPSGSFINGMEHIGSGSESDVYRDGDTVVKVSEPYSDKSEESYNERVRAAQLVDELVGDRSLEVIGHYESANGTRNPVFRQKFTDGRAATREEIKSHMESRGFSIKESGKYSDTYSKEINGVEYTVKDLDSDNVRVDASGIHVIDAAIIQRKAKQTPAADSIPAPTKGEEKSSPDVSRSITLTDKEAREGRSLEQQKKDAMRVGDGDKVDAIEEKMAARRDRIQARAQKESSADVPAKKRAAVDMTREEFQREGVDRVENGISEAKEQQIIPYFMIRRNLAQGRFRFEAYDENGKLIATARSISGPSSISGKFARRKGRYWNVVNANYEFATDEKFSKDALYKKISAGQGETHDRITAKQQPSAQPVNQQSTTAPASAAQVEPKQAETPAPESTKAAKPFNAKEWDKERQQRIDESKAAGNKHLDDVYAAVETMRGKEIYYVHDQNEKGVVRTVSNRGDVVVHWLDKYSADKNSATEKTERRGKKEVKVYESWLMPSDLKDYVFADSKKKPASESTKFPISKHGSAAILVEGNPDDIKAKLAAAGIKAKGRVKKGRGMLFPARMEGEIRGAVEKEVQDDSVQRDTDTVDTLEEAAAPAKVAEKVEGVPETVVDGKRYRPTGQTTNVNGKSVGVWEFEYKGEWKPVRSVQQRIKADEAAIAEDTEPKLSQSPTTGQSLPSLRSALLSSEYGARVEKLIEQGRLKLVQSASTLDTRNSDSGRVETLENPLVRNLEKPGDFPDSASLGDEGNGSLGGPLARLRRIESPDKKSGSDVRLVNTKKLANLAEGHTFSAKGFGKLDVPSQLRMLSLVRNVISQQEVFDSVVKLVPVDVVNVFRIKELTPKMLLHHPSMLKYARLLESRGDISIPVGGNASELAATSAISEIARSGAEVFSPATSMVPGKLLPAEMADGVSFHNPPMDSNGADTNNISQYATERKKKNNNVVAGAYVKSSDTTYLFSDGIAPGAEVSVLLHEMLHRMVDQGKFQPFIDELSAIDQKVKNGPVADWIAKAKKSALVDEGKPHFWEEVMAYSVQQYNEAPGVIRRWVDRLIAKVKVWLAQSLGLRVGKLTPAMLREIAVQGLNIPYSKTGVSESQNLGLGMSDEPAFSQLAKSPGISIKEANNVVNAVDRFVAKGSEARFKEVIRKARFVYNRRVADKLAAFSAEKGGVPSLVETWLNQSDDSIASKEAERRGLAFSELDEQYLSDIQAVLDKDGTKVSASKFIDYMGAFSGRLNDFLSLAAEQRGEIAFQAKKAQAAINSAIPPGQFSPADDRIMYSIDGKPIKHVTPEMLNSPEFKKWQGDSKFKEPVWHGTDSKGFLQDGSWIFDASKGKSKHHSPLAGLGNFFAEDRTEAAGYSSGGNGVVRPFYVAVENPLRLKSYDSRLNNLKTREEAAAFAKRMQARGHDGIYLEDQGHVIVFDEGNIKSAEFNTGDFDSDNQDVRYTVQQADDDYDSDLAEAAANLNQRKPKNDISGIGPILSTADYLLNVDPAGKALFETQPQRRDKRFELENEIFGQSEPKTGFVHEMTELEKEDLKEYKTANDYLLETDATRDAFRIKHWEGFVVRGLDGEIIEEVDSDDIGHEVAKKQFNLASAKKYITPVNTIGGEKEYKVGDRTVDDYEKAIQLARDMARENKEYIKDYKVEPLEHWKLLDRKGKLIKTLESENEAKESLEQAEHDDLTEKGFSFKATGAVLTFRRMTNRAFDKQIADLKKIIADCAKLGIDPPTVQTVDESRRFGVFGQGKRVGEYETRKIAEEHVRSLMKTDPKKYAGLEVRRQKDSEIKKESTLQDMIAIMGELRGSYFPRQRDKGRVILRAVKGDSKIMEKFDFYALDREYTDPETGEVVRSKARQASSFIKKMFNEITAHVPFVKTLEKRARELRRDGYAISVERDTSLPESVFDAAGLIASISSLMDESLEQIREKELLGAAAQEANKVITQKMAELFKKRGFLSSRLGRTDDYWEGFEPDMLKAGTQYAKGMAAGLAKRESAQKMVLIITGRDISWDQWKAEKEDPQWEDYQKFVSERRIDPKRQPNLYKEAISFTREMLRNEEQGDRVLGTLRGLATFKYLSFRVSSAAVNGTNMVQAVPAVMSADTGCSITEALAEIGRAAAKYLQYRRGKLEGVDAAIFDDISQRGWIIAQFNNEAAAALRHKVGNALDTFLGWGMFLFGEVEKVNRATTIFASYKQFKKQHPEIGYEEALEKAKHVSDGAHAIYDKSTAPAWTWGANNPAKLLYTFIHFSHNYMLKTAEMIGKDQWKQAGYMLLSPAIIGGMGASVVTKALFLALGLGGDDDDPEEKFYAWVDEQFGSDTIARQGLFGLAGVNIKGSLQINNPFPTRIEEILGAPGAVFFDTKKGIEHVAKGEYYKGFESIMPAAFGNISRGIREHSEGVTTSSYTPVYYGMEPLQSTDTETFLRFLSFNPARISGIREKQWSEKQVLAKYNGRKAEIYSSYKRYLLLPPEKRTKKRMAPILKMIEGFNEDVLASGRRDIHPITDKTIKSAMRRAFTPNRMEKIRAAENDEL